MGKGEGKEKEKKGWKSRERRKAENKGEQELKNQIWLELPS